MSAATMRGSACPPPPCGGRDVRRRHAGARACPPPPCGGSGCPPPPCGGSGRGAGGRGGWDAAPGVEGEVRHHRRAGAQGAVREDAAVLDEGPEDVAVRAAARVKGASHRRRHWAEKVGVPERGANRRHRHWAQDGSHRRRHWAQDGSHRHHRRDVRRERPRLAGWSGMRATKAPTLLWGVAAGAGAAGAGAETLLLENLSVTDGKPVCGAAGAKLRRGWMRALKPPIVWESMGLKPSSPGFLRYRLQ